MLFLRSSVNQLQIQIKHKIPRMVSVLQKSFFKQRWTLPSGNRHNRPDFSEFDTPNGSKETSMQNSKIHETNVKLSKCLKFTDSLLMENESLKKRLTSIEIISREKKPLKVIKLKSRLKSQSNDEENLNKELSRKGIIRLNTCGNGFQEIQSRRTEHKPTYSEVRGVDEDLHPRTSLNSASKYYTNHANPTAAHTRNFLELMNSQSYHSTSRNSEVSPIRSLVKLEEKLKKVQELYSASVNDYGFLLGKFEAQMGRSKSLGQEISQIKTESVKHQDGLRAKDQLIELKDRCIQSKDEQIMRLGEEYDCRISMYQESISQYQKEIQSVKNQFVAMKITLETNGQSKKRLARQIGQEVHQSRVQPDPQSYHQSPVLKETSDKSVECHLLNQSSVDQGLQTVDSETLNCDELIVQIIQKQSLINQLQEENESLSKIIQQAEQAEDSCEPLGGHQSPVRLARSFSRSPNRDISRLHEQNLKLLISIYQKDIRIAQLSRRNSILERRPKQIQGAPGPMDQTVQPIQDY